MKANTLLLGLIVLLVGGLVFASSWSYSPLPNQSYGSDTMPRAVGLLGLGIGLALLFQGWAQGQRRPVAVVLDWARDPGRMTTMGAAILGVIAYVTLSDLIGFLPVAFVLVLTLMRLRQTRWPLALAAAALAALAVQQVFGRLLLVPLPRTEFLSFLW